MINFTIWDCDANFNINDKLLPYINKDSQHKTQEINRPIFALCKNSFFTRGILRFRYKLDIDTHTHTPKLTNKMTITPYRNMW